LRQLQRMHYVADVVPHQLFIIENTTQLTGHYVPYGATPGTLTDARCRYDSSRGRRRPRSQHLHGVGTILSTSTAAPRNLQHCAGRSDRPPW
jgi:hypothetical protein